MNARRWAGYDFDSAGGPSGPQIVGADSKGVGEGSEVPGSRHRSAMKVVREVTSAELRICAQNRCGLPRRFAQTPASAVNGGFQPLGKGRLLAVVLGMIPLKLL